MKTQQDTEVRMVALENLKAMCERVSGMCHRFWVESFSNNRVRVGYSNPNEYGAEHPMFAVFPAFPSIWPDDKENPRVILEILKVIHDSWDGEGWQAFEPLTNCPIFWRHPETGKWETLGRRGMASV